VDGYDFWNTAPPETVPEQFAGSDMISVTDAILSDLLQEFPIDRARIYLAGISSGGTGCWQYSLRLPKRFAAVAPMAGSRQRRWKCCGGCGERER
jgi:predicted peptidase